MTDRTIESGEHLSNIETSLDGRLQRETYTDGGRTRRRFTLNGEPLSTYLIEAEELYNELFEVGKLDPKDRVDIPFILNITSTLSKIGQEFEVEGYFGGPMRNIFTRMIRDIENSSVKRKLYRIKNNALRVGHEEPTIASFIREMATEYGVKAKSTELAQLLRTRHNPTAFCMELMAIKMNQSEEVDFKKPERQLGMRRINDGHYLLVSTDFKDSSKPIEQLGYTEKEKDKATKGKTKAVVVETDENGSVVIKRMYRRIETDSNDLQNELSEEQRSIIELMKDPRTRYLTREEENIVRKFEEKHTIFWRERAQLFEPHERDIRPSVLSRLLRRSSLNNPRDEDTSDSWLSQREDLVVARERMNAEIDRELKGDYVDPLRDEKTAVRGEDMGHYNINASGFVSGTPDVISVHLLKELFEGDNPFTYDILPPESPLRIVLDRLVNDLRKQAAANQQEIDISPSGVSIERMMRTLHEVLTQSSKGKTQAIPFEQIDMKLDRNTPFGMILSNLAHPKTDEDHTPEAEDVYIVSNPNIPHGYAICLEFAFAPWVFDAAYCRLSTGLYNASTHSAIIRQGPHLYTLDEYAKVTFTEEQNNLVIYNAGCDSRDNYMINFTPGRSPKGRIIRLVFVSPEVINVPSNSGNTQIINDVFRRFIGNHSN